MADSDIRTEQKEVETNLINKDPKQKKNSKTSQKNIIFFIVAISVFIIIVFLAIFLPLILVKKKVDRMIKPLCPDGKKQPRIDCLPDKNNLLNSGQSLESACRQRKCCWSTGGDVGGPSCFFHYNYGFRNFKTKESSFATQWYELLRTNSPDSFARSDIANLEVKIEMHTDNRLRIRIYPRRNFKNKLQRWEIPSGAKGEHLFKPEYRIEYSDLPFSFKVIRNKTGQVIFDTHESPLVFSNQFLQITTKLSSPYIFGIGENSKEHFIHDLNYKSWPLFASQNHPYNSMENQNLYSQFPAYLNIEPDGNSHMVVFYNSNPSEFYLTPFPSLTFRSMGGIFDIYIFSGPTPVQAIEQYQQTFGLPKLPPYWSLGPQISVKKFKNEEHINQLISNLKNSKLGFDSILVGLEHMINATMFTQNYDFINLKTIVEKLRSENRATILQLVPAIGNNTPNYPFSEGISLEKYWIMENFFSLSVIGQLLGRHVLYPDFTMEKTRQWWKDALQRHFVTNEKVKFDGIYFDYLTPYDENINKTCPNNKWNNPPYKFDFISNPIYNATICMDSRYEISKHYNIHGIYSHYVIDATAAALDSFIHNRTLIMSRHAFIGTGQHSIKWLGEFNSQWDDFRKSIISTVEMSMFGFSMAGADLCGNHGEFDSDLCSEWIKASSMSPLMRISFESGLEEDEKFKILTKNGLFDVLNSSICLRYSLLPYFYTQFYKAAAYGTPVVRPIAFEYPIDTRSYKIDNQWMWGDKLMVSIGTNQGGLSSIFFPKGDWYDYYRGFYTEGNGEMAGAISRRNETNLHIRGGSVIFTQDCMETATDSKYTYIDIRIALNISDNYTASGELYIDDSSKKNTPKKENYHRLISFKVYREENDGIIEVRKVSGRFATRLSYRDIKIYGLKSKPTRITVNENSQAIDGSKCVWDDYNQAYHVNLQTEVKRKVLLDTEYLNFRWTGGFDAIKKQKS
ncbi:unnamed protein product [Brachionus calyciflorus]|uniref:P-type domain-containing protein n=1 Tax=Brachionus calyciflorus TaxID=104777 RepID=A0A813XBQ3_9BILA|nr:unnamed protein product [Brachionus calyciflorus]